MLAASTAQGEDNEEEDDSWLVRGPNWGNARLSRDSELASAGPGWDASEGFGDEEGEAGYEGGHAGERLPLSMP